MKMEVKKGYKKTEVGVIPEDWEVKALGDIGSVKMCKRIFSYQTKVSGAIPFYKIGTFGKEADAFISEELYSSYRSRFSFPKKGDILISASGTIGRTVIYDGKPAYYQDSNIIWIENNERLVTNKYLYHVLQVVKYGSEGSTIQRLYNSIVMNTKFLLAPLPEQTAIATVLSDTDSLIQALEKKIAKKELIKKGAMQELLKPKEGWEKKALGEESELITKGTTPTSIGRSFVNEGVNFIKVESLKKDGKFNSEMFAFIDNQTHLILKRSQLKENDLVISIAGALGRTGIVNKDVLPANTNQALALVRLKSNSGINLNYAFHFLRTKKIEKHIDSITSQGAQPNLSLQNISELQIEFPKMKEQISIAQILTDMDNEIESLQKKLSKYKQLKQGLMQELLTGKIRLV